MRLPDLYHAENIVCLSKPADTRQTVPREKA